jgi:hypothetical protein
MMRSLELNPVRKGMPVSAKLHSTREEVVNGMALANPPIL